MAEAKGGGGEGGGGEGGGSERWRKRKVAEAKGGGGEGGGAAVVAYSSNTYVACYRCERVKRLRTN